MTIKWSSEKKATLIQRAYSCSSCLMIVGRLGWIAAAANICQFLTPAREFPVARATRTGRTPRWKPVPAWVLTITGVLRECYYYWFQLSVFFSPVCHLTSCHRNPKLPNTVVPGDVRASSLPNEDDWLGNVDGCGQIVTVIANFTCSFSFGIVPKGLRQ